MADKQISGNIFTEEGRLSQAEFAIKNVSEAGTIMGMVCTNGVVLVGINPAKSTSLEKIYKINEKAYVAVSGIFSDALRLVKYARLQSALINEYMGKHPRTLVLCELISMEKEYYTQIANARPFGVSFLYSGYEDDEYVLYSTDPSGTINKWKACCFGMDSDAINACLRNEMDDHVHTLEEGIEKLLKIYGKAKEWTPGLAERMEVLAYEEHRSRVLKYDEVQNIVSNISREDVVVRE